MNFRLFLESINLDELCQHLIYVHENRLDADSVLLLADYLQEFGDKDYFDFGKELASLANGNKEGFRNKWQPSRLEDVLPFGDIKDNNMKNGYLYFLNATGSISLYLDWPKITIEISDSIKKESEKEDWEKKEDESEKEDWEKKEDESEKEDWENNTTIKTYTYNEFFNIFPKAQNNIIKFAICQIIALEREMNFFAPNVKNRQAKDLIAKLQDKVYRLPDQINLDRIFRTNNVTIILQDIKKMIETLLTLKDEQTIAKLKEIANILNYQLAFVHPLTNHPTYDSMLTNHPAYNSIINLINKIEKL